MDQKWKSGNSYLRTLQSWTQRLSVRWSFAFLGMFLICSATLFTLLYFLLVHSLEQKDREVTEAAFQRYKAVFMNSGISGVEREIHKSGSTKENAQLLVRFEENGEGLLLETPADFEQYRPQEAEKELSRQAKREPPVRWFKLVSPSDDEDIIEVRQEKMSGGAVLQVGKNTEDLEELLDRFRNLFILIMIPGLLIGVCGAWFLSNRWLRPIRNLISTLQFLKGGKSGSRVQEITSNDELAVLTRMFNEMLDQNDKLIQGMKDSLDFVAHDLRTPMTRFRAKAEKALRLKSVSEKQEALAEAMESSEEILSLLTGLMDISEAESGAITLKKKILPVAEIFRSVQDLYALVAEDGNVSLEWSCPSDLVILADLRIKQAVANLVDNALKFSTSGGRVDLLGFRQDNKIIIQIKDEGVGISKEEQGRIWDRLYRGDSSRSTRGLGLGLSLVKSIVGAHDGQVEVHSEVSRGSCFQIILPGAASTFGVR